MNKSAADVEREVEASRNDLDRTVEALKDKMTPGQLFDEASRAMGGAGQHVLSKFVGQVKENPMPLAVMGLGLAWLMSGAGKSRGSAGDGYAEPRSFAIGGGDASAASGLSDKVHAVGDKVSDKVHAVGDKASGMIAGAKDKLSSAASKVGGTATSAVGKMGDYGKQAQRSFGRMLESEPLLIGAAGLLVGAAVGAALPRTDLEDRTVGPMRDKLLEKGKDLAQDGLQQAEDVAQAAYGSVKEELKNADAGGDPVQRTQDIARGAVQAGRQALESPPN